MCIPHDGLYVFAVRVTGYMAVTYDSRVQCLSRSVVEGSMLASHGLWTRMNLLRVRKGFSLNSSSSETSMPKYSFSMQRN